MAEFAGVTASSRMAMEVGSLRPKISYTFFSKYCEHTSSNFGK